MNLSLSKPYLRVIVIAAEMSLKMAAADAFIIFGVLFQPLIIALLGMWMLQGRGGDYAIFVVIGSGMTGLWSSLLFVSGNSITQERWVGTLEMMAGLPTPLQVIVFGKNIANVLQSLLSMIASYALVAIFFGYSLTIAQPGLFVISLIFTVISFVCFGLMIAPVFVLNPDVQRWQNGLEYPVYILGGFLFPIALLPGWTTPHQLRARALLGGAGPAPDFRWRFKFSRGGVVLGHDAAVQRDLRDRVALVVQGDDAPGAHRGNAGSAMIN